MTLPRHVSTRTCTLRPALLMTFTSPPGLCPTAACPALPGAPQLSDRGAAVDAKKYEGMLVRLPNLTFMPCVNQRTALTGDCRKGASRLDGRSWVTSNQRTDSTCNVGALADVPSRCILAVDSYVFRSRTQCVAKAGTTLDGITGVVLWVSGPDSFAHWAIVPRSTKDLEGCVAPGVSIAEREPTATARKLSDGTFYRLIVWHFL